jgi:hypothetical protein
MAIGADVAEWGDVVMGRIEIIGNTQMTKSKRGRPRLDRPRYPSGQVRPKGAGITHTALQRLRSLGTNPVLGTQVGRLLFLGEIDMMQAQTAWRIAEIYGRYDRAMGRQRSAASPAYEAGRGRDTGLAESEDEAARHQAAVRRFERVQEALREIASWPRTARVALEELCVEDRAIPGEWMLEVKVVLDRLAAPLGLRGRKRA